MTTQAQQKRDEQAEARTKLREWIKPGDTVSTINRHVAKSGMSRSISVIITDEDGARDVSGFVARAVGMKFDRDRGGVKVSGCGMDMGFHLVYSLAHALFASDGFACTGEAEYRDGDCRRIKPCPSNDHSNGDRDYTPHVHSDPGYALRQEWL